MTDEVVETTERVATATPVWSKGVGYPRSGDDWDPAGDYVERQRQRKPVASKSGRKTVTDFERRQYLTQMINDGKNRVEQTQRMYLEHTGWTYSSSNNPRCMWLWEKLTANGHVTACTDQAVEQQKAIDSLDGVYDDPEHQVEG